MDKSKRNPKNNQKNKPLNNSAKAYTDGKVEAAISEHMVKKYEITDVPKYTIVDYREKEIRVMCPANTQWVKQNVGSTGNANMYYMSFKAYAPEGAVSFKEGELFLIDKVGEHSRLQVREEIEERKSKGKFSAS